MNAKIIDKRAIRLSQMCPGQVAIACVANRSKVDGLSGTEPYRAIYAKAYKDESPRGEGARTVYVELTNLQNQYMDKVVAEDPLVILLEKNQVVELSNFDL